jgi:hypothetical protein
MLHEGPLRGVLLYILQLMAEGLVFYKTLLLVLRLASLQTPLSTLRYYTLYKALR